MIRRLILWLFTLSACAGVVLVTSYGFSPASTEVQWRLVDVPPRSAISDIADRLQSLGIIRSKVCFLAAARLSGQSRFMQPGQYRLSPSMAPVDIVNKLAQGEVATDWVVVPEGSTLKQIGRILAEHGLTKGQRYETALHQLQRVYRRPFGLEAPTLEGYLFPDTYKVPKTMTEYGMVRLMLERFRQVVLIARHDKIQNATCGLKFWDTMILASLVEKEARHDEERDHIAGVLINRLRNGMKLECDASIEYALPEHKPKLTHEDLLIDSPYNTYRHRGLPPSPICSPGIPSIEAALRPAATHDLYYVASPDGYHLFSQTLAEHDKAITKVKEMQADRSL